METLELDRTSPVPLYHQIVQAIRWRIGTGLLRAGEALPPLREAAETWEVNYHTVRRAYHELASQGWVESAQGSGTRVAEAAPADPAPNEELNRWIDEVVRVGAERFGLSGVELTHLIGARGAVGRVVMVECNAHQAATLARQLEGAWSVEAIPWDLNEAGDPPLLPLIGTFFHHAEMRRRWPDRVEEMHFVAVRPDAALMERIEAAADRGTRVLRLVEEDPATAREMANAVASVLPPRFTVEPVVGDPAELLDGLGESELLLVAPRLWDHLPERVRGDGRVFDVQPTVVAEDLDRVWRALKLT